jgi:cysteine-rich repeat protein
MHGESTLVFWLLIMLGSCVESVLPQQGELLCPTDQFVIADRCGSTEEIAACAEPAQGARCTTFTVNNGWCDAGICYLIVCGNTVVEPGEICDDTNNVDNDGCKDDCSSLETCGDGVLNSAADRAVWWFC